MNTQIEISNRIISSKNETFIIAEMSANHLQNYDFAVKTLKEAKKCGADAIKLQTYTADTMTIDCDNNYFQINQGTLWDGKTLYKLYEEAYTPWEWYPKLKKMAEEIDIILFSTPFDKTAVDFLEKMDVPAYKIASFEITDIPLIEYTAKCGKPMIISTGLAYPEEIEKAVKVCKNNGNNDIILLKCTSSYPAPIENANLLTIKDIMSKFNVISGLSDHTMGIASAVASVVLGGRVIEKHFILDRNLGGPDSAFSMEPDEFKLMVKTVREVEKSLGKVSYELSEQVKKNRVFTRSLFVVEDISKGELFTKKNVRSIRPGYGISPEFIYEVIGKKAIMDIERGTPLKWELIQK